MKASILILEEKIYELLKRNLLSDKEYFSLRCLLENIEYRRNNALEALEDGDWDRTYEELQ